MIRVLHQFQTILGKFHRAILILQGDGLDLDEGQDKSSTCERFQVDLRKTDLRFHQSQPSLKDHKATNQI